VLPSEQALEQLHEQLRMQTRQLSKVIGEARARAAAYVGAGNDEEGGRYPAARVREIPCEPAAVSPALGPVPAIYVPARSRRTVRAWHRQAAWRRTARRVAAHGWPASRRNLASQPG